MAQYIYRVLETQDGERQYNHIAVHELDDDTNVDEFLDELISTFWGYGDKVENGNGYWFFDEIITKLSTWRYITKDEYDVLTKFI